VSLGWSRLATRYSPTAPDRERPGRNWLACRQGDYSSRIERDPVAGFCCLLLAIELIAAWAPEGAELRRSPSLDAVGGAFALYQRPRRDCDSSPLRSASCAAEYVPGSATRVAAVAHARQSFYDRSGRAARLAGPACTFSHSFTNVPCSTSAAPDPAVRQR